MTCELCGRDEEDEMDFYNAYAESVPIVVCRWCYSLCAEGLAVGVSVHPVIKRPRRSRR